MLRVEAVQSGALVPVAKAWSFDSAKDDPSVAAELHRLLESCAFADVEETHSKPQPDRGVLAICVETDAGLKRLAIPVGNVPAQLAPLVQFLEPRLKWRPRPA